MKWNWQRPNWPHFDYDPAILQGREERFKLESSKLIGATSIITEEQQQGFMIDLMSEEALKSSGIEGELLNRDSVASSLLRQFGFAPEYSDHRANDKEKGIAALMIDNYHSYDQPLTHELLFRWHPCIVAPSLFVRDVGKYRTSPEPMRIVSGYEGQQVVHYEAPPAARIPGEMEAYIQWFNDTATDGKSPLPALERAAIAHIYFEAIHPFEDGNGRIGRVLSEKALAQCIGRPALIALSHAIEKSRPEYYSQLERNQKSLLIDSWLSFFADTVLNAVAHSQKLIQFIVEKSRLLGRVRGQVNERQEKALLRMFAEGVEGFKGGMSANKYMKITGTINRTASRDLQALVELGALVKTGKLKGTRYWLNLGETFEEQMREHLAGQGKD